MANSDVEATLERELRARGFHAVAGVDEVGRGCLFGPVVAGAVILSPDRPVRGLNDSKLLEAGTARSAGGTHPRARRGLGRGRRGCRHHRRHQYLPGLAPGHAHGGGATASRARFPADRRGAHRSPRAAARAHQGRCALPRHRRRLHRRQSLSRRLHVRLGRSLSRLRPGLAQRLLHAGALAGPPASSAPRRCIASVSSRCARCSRFPLDSTPQMDLFETAGAA